MKNCLLTAVAAIFMWFSAQATTCPNAQVIPAGQTLPYTVSSMVCGTVNDMTATNMPAPQSAYYHGGLESVYVWTPSSSFGSVSISYTGQSYSGIFVYQGCPTSGGTFVAGITTSSTSKVLNLNAFTPGVINTATPSTGAGNVNLQQGVTYYIVFDTWPSPASPCTGSFTISGTQLAGCTEPLATGAATANVPDACSGVNFNLSLTTAAALNALSGVASQWQRSTDNGVTWNDIANATSINYTVSQTVATQYRCRLVCSGGTLSYSTPVIVPMSNFVNCYCTSNPLYAPNVNIYNVKIGSINNASTCTTLAPGALSVAGRYSNYNTLPAANLNQNASHDITLTMGNCSSVNTASNYVKVYVDLNQDGVFDPVTELLAGQGGVGAFTTTKQLFIPTTATLGTTRMRIVFVQSATAATVNPCGTYSYGETEDYLVNIIAPPTCLQPSNIITSGSTNSSINVNWLPGASETSWVVYYYPTDTGTLATAQTAVVNTTPSTQLTGLLANKSYIVRVRAVCSPTDTSLYSVPGNFNTFGVGNFFDFDNTCGPGFASIATNPAAINLALTDDAEVNLTPAFPIFYQGVAYPTVRVGANGGILFATTGDVGYYHILNTPQLSVYQQDLNPASSFSNDVFALELGTAPNRQLIVEWNNVVEYGGTGTGVTVQVVYLESTKEIFYLYDNVVHGNSGNDYGANAEIAATGPQNAVVSLNNATYLQNNSCVRFYYADCPKPTNITVTGITNAVAVVSWSAGLANEGAWRIEYGPAGFTPGTGTVVNNIMTTTHTLTNLQNVTLYDVYVYAACTPSVESDGLKATFWTLPNCSNPTALAATTGTQLINATWAWNPAVYPVLNFNVKYTNSYGVQTGVYNSQSPNFNATVIDTALMGGGIYNVWVQAVCTSDTSNYVGPIQVTMPLTNNDVCNAQFLQVDGVNRLFSGLGATTQPGEAALEQPVAGAHSTNGWAQAQITHSVWYKFTAPASGKVRVDATGINVDGQIAIYSTIACNDFAQFTFVAGNDDDLSSASLSPNFTVCSLNPGQTYFMVYDPRSTTTAINQYNIKISDIQHNSGTANALATICTGSVIDLFSTLSNNDTIGTWIDPINTGKLSGSTFASAGLAYQTFNFYYKIVDGCSVDSTYTQVKVYAPSSAGTGIAITACKNQPINLLSGLSGNVDLGGTWNDPSGNAISGPSIITNPVASQSNYTYITSNGVCPADTSTVMVNVINTCDYLSMDDLELEGMEMYPNPTEGLTTIKYVGASSEVFSYEVLDVNGRVIAKDLQVLSATQNAELDLRGKEAGLYMIRVFNDSNSKVFKLMVK